MHDNITFVLKAIQYSASNLTRKLSEVLNIKRTSFSAMLKDASHKET